MDVGSQPIAFGLVAVLEVLTPTPSGFSEYPSEYIQYPPKDW